MGRPPGDDDDLPAAQGLPLPLRLLALIGAFSFLMIGLSSVVPLLRPPPPRPMPDQHRGPLV
ncbi:MAG: hypothetical protein EA413_05620 [Cyanobium sp. PLM2.Bin73]|jgi:hypothetical protein|nr:MAG: hypothetical protein EA413_05620 [Cyanobium sp. PLM2.Bin73]